MLDPHHDRAAFANGENNVQFTGSTMNIIPIYQLISSILPFGKNCQLNITKEGLCFTIVDNNICKVLLTLDKRLFNSYQFNPRTRSNEVEGSATSKQDRTVQDAQRTTDTENDEPTEDEEDDEEDDDALESISVNLDLKSLIETINIHIPTDKDALDFKTKCILSYNNDGDPFILTFEDELIIERCELITLFMNPMSAQERVHGKSRGRSKRVLTSQELRMQYGESNDDAEFEDSIEIATDNSIFQLDSSKLIFEIILKSSVFYDVLKDMKDLNTDEFILYCSKETPTQPAKYGNDSESKRRLVFISRSEDDVIGYSKLITPEKRPFLKEMELYKPVFKNTSTSATAWNEREVDMIPAITNISSFYNFGYFSKIIKGIKLSKLIKIRKDLNGLTSLSLLISSSGLNASHELGSDGKSIYYGTSIEFMTLESIALEDRHLTFTSGSDNIQQERNLSSNSIDADLLRFGYRNRSIEQMIRDDENINVIKIAGDGHLTTIDDFFQPDYGDQNFSEPVMNHNTDRLRERSEPTNIPLNITEALAQSVLGHDVSLVENQQDINARNGIDVNQTVEEENVRETRNKRLRGHKATGKKREGNNTSKKKRKDDIHTVGGAIEIPLFI
ncbi:hypothetical protein CANARDRAFT_29769 [[Candida] arabinofermentans NRRL YB-2248]|uniref:DNA damage checkpoint control protein RAD17 n=1 Tax=[Candida] arabinofermentans NRRL YB-2248 TaxID=983967 RepID=A0A1E4SWH8_9ASCO|nr:hypothetical protein CANARDRAFT_29769 [[Candida] arabinofermentans NRRL YB-2248]